MVIVPIYEAIEEIHRFLYLNQNNKKYENLLMDDWLIEPVVNKGTWSTAGVAFKDNDGRLLGWGSVHFDRPSNIISVSSLAILDRKYSVHIFRFITKFLESKMTARVPKLTFGTLVGSHAETLWDRLIERYNGEIVGIKRNDIIDIEGNYRDIKMYTIHNPKFKL